MFALYNKFNKYQDRKMVSELARISAVLFKVDKLFSLSCIILVFKLHWIEINDDLFRDQYLYARVKQTPFTRTRVISLCSGVNPGPINVLEGHSAHPSNCSAYLSHMVMNNHEQFLSISSLHLNYISKLFT